ncbi:hypothetical protein DFH09DRAFT_1366924 [Mycena vulgaris]|nr:hypothetical protein DFH09DRAFT_1366924 [Mycena vulgaris]
MSSVASSSSTTPTPSPLAPCVSDYQGGRLNNTFSGCVIGVVNFSVLQTCCTAAGSTAGFVNGTCGCPFSAAFPGTEAAQKLRDDFFKCVETDPLRGGKTQVGTCDLASAAGRPLRWNGNAVIVGLVLGVALIAGAVGV